MYNPFGTGLKWFKYGYDSPLNCECQVRDSSLSITEPVSYILGLKSHV